jgi:hypothetical protein
MVRAIRDTWVYVIQHGIRTNKHLFLRNRKKLRWKRLPSKGIFVAELVRRIIDTELDREQKQKG